MFNIDENLIKKYSDDINFIRGKRYFKEDRVLDLDIEEFKGVTLIYAMVESAADEYTTYDVNIKFDKNELQFFACDCKAFESIGTTHFCKHIVAVLLKYCEEVISVETSLKTNNKNTKLFESLKTAIINHVNDKSEQDIRKQLHLAIKYEFEGLGSVESSVELKVGENKLYVVKNMREFLEAVKNNEKLGFGKNFTFNPVVHSFSNQDKEIIDFLYEALENDKLLQSRLYSYHYNSNIPKLVTGKKVYFTEGKLVAFLSMIKDREIEAVIRENSFSQVKILFENMPLQFDIKENAKKNIVLLFKKHMPLALTSKESCFFYNDSIYVPTKQQVELYTPFHNAFIASNYKEIEFSKEEKSYIASLVIPNLKAISHHIQVENVLEESFYEAPLVTEIFFDKKQEGITAEIKYKYGEEYIEVLEKQDKTKKHKVLIRDIKKELEVVDILIKSGFNKKDNLFFLDEEEELLAFISSGIYKLEPKADIFYSDGFKEIKIYNSSSYKSGIRLNDNKLLEFNFSIEGVDREELKDIFNALRQKKKYYKLKKGGFVDLEAKELNEVSDVLNYLDIKDEALLKDKITLSKYNCLYLDEKLKAASFYVERNKSFREMVNNMKEIHEMEFEVPTTLKPILRGYQNTGFKWFKTLASYGFGGILADEMGLGKTLQAIAFLQSEAEENKKPSLVIAPTSLVYNWQEEINKFAPQLKTMVVCGNKDERFELLKECKQQDVIITSYPLIRRDIEEYKGFDFNYCILDEAQQIKNSNSINAKSVKDIKAKGYFALTGTPIENTVMELWSIFDFIMPGYLLSSRKFSQKYEVPIVKKKDEKALKELNKHIRPFILRRLKKDVIKELPPKIEHQLLVTMTDEQKKVYAAFATSLKQEIDSEIKTKGFNKSKIKILSALTRLRQICCDPSVFLENYEGNSGKIEALEQLVEESINSDHRILLFSQFTSVLKNIKKRLDKNNVEMLYLDGSTKMEERGKLVKAFNEGMGKVFLISLKAGGTGLNLTGADTVIHFDPWWNPAVEEQASDRAHRIGQKNTVEVIKLIAKGTIEEKIAKMQEKKKEMIKNIMDEGSAEEFLLANMTEDDMKDLFTI